MQKILEDISCKICIIKNILQSTQFQVKYHTLIHINDSNINYILINKIIKDYFKISESERQPFIDFIKLNATPGKIQYESIITPQESIFRIKKTNILKILAHTFIMSFQKTPNSDYLTYLKYWNGKSKNSSFKNFFTFIYWTNNIINNCNINKILCIINYFYTIFKNPTYGINEYVTFHKRRAPIIVLNMSHHMKLSKIEASTLTIEEFPNDIQADFANTKIGGGVLQGGNVQEEIRFTISPECLISMIFFKDNNMTDDESMLIHGTCIFSKYRGYGSSFEFIKEEINNTFQQSNRDIIVAFDAADYSSSKDEPNKSSKQYTKKVIDREINKCCSAFAKWACNDNKDLATGNWGCGVFLGDYKLKFFIQWIAASICGRNLKYCCFDNIIKDIRKEEYQTSFNRAYNKFRFSNVQDLYNLIIDSNESTINALF